MLRPPRLPGLVDDVRLSLRLIRRSPGFTVLAVIALGLGIGANTAIFSVVDAVLLRPLPYDQPERLAVVLHHGTDPVSAANLLDWRREATSFSGVGAAELWAATLAGAERPERVSGLRVTADLFGLLGVRPALGRLFRADEGEPGREHEVILAHSLWVRNFGAAPEIVGRTVQLDGVPYTVVGVMGPDFRFPPFWATGTEIWTPLPLAPRATDRGGNSLRAFARLAPGVSLERAQAEITTITRRLEAAYPGTNRDVRVVGLTDRVVSGVRPALWILAAAVGFVLLIACANVAHLLLARAAARRQELAVRSALGASRGRLVRQLLTESALLAGLGGAVGLLLAAGAVRLLIGLGPASIPRLAGVTLDGPVLLFTVAMSLLTGLGFGLLPALTTADVGVSETLKAGASRAGTGTARHHRTQDLLVASEFALAVILLIGAGLAIRTFAALRAIDPGFDPRGVTGMIVSVAGTESGQPGRRATFYRELLDRLGQAPGVDAVGGINHLPIAGDVWGFPYRIEGRPDAAPGNESTAVFRAVLPGYFATMRLPVVEGRDVAWADQADTPGVVIVNRTLAEREWPGESPIGKRLAVGGSADHWRTVVGVSHDEVQGDWASPIRPAVYLPLLQTDLYLTGGGPAFSFVSLVVRSPSPPDGVEATVRQVLASIDRGVPVSSVRSLEEVVGQANAEPRFYLVLLATFAAVAVVLAAVGIYGVMSHAVARRTREIGIRMALGAGRREVLRLVVGRGVAVALGGAAAGLLGALALGRLMTAMLWGVSATDPITFVTVPLLLAAVALVATLGPGLRATRIEPLAAVRRE